MEIPTLDSFHPHPGTAHGPSWWVDPAGAEFTLTIPGGDTAGEPHEPSYRLALVVLAELEALTRTAVEYLARGIDFADWRMTGEPELNTIECDARAETVTLWMSWESKFHGEWSVTFYWRERDGVPRCCWPQGFAFRHG